MKTLHTSVAALALMAIVSGSAFAEGSRITNSTLNNSSNNSNSRTTATNGEANTGSIVVQGGSRVQNSTINNSSNNSGAVTNAGTGGGFLGIGARSGVANAGSIVVRD